MAARKSQSKTQEVQKATLTEDVSRFRLGEIGYSGLKITSGVAQEEIKRELNFPNSMITYKQMTYHATIAAALYLYEVMLAKVDWKVLPPEDATEEEKYRTRYIEECMHDMDHSWSEFIQEVSSAKTYGFAVHEKVFRTRLKSKGSKYNDGLIGWKKLAPRSQDTIDKFIYDEEGRELKALKQNLSLVQDGYSRFTRAVKGKEIIIPMSKVLLFRTGKHRGNPFGKSALRDCYFSWKFLTQIEEIEATGVARDLQGLPIVSIPSVYMTSDATDSQKAIYDNFKNIARNIQINQQGGIVLPSDVDPESKQPMFKLELLGTEGKKNFNTASICDAHRKAILTVLGCDLLLLGQSSTGSFALGSLKQTLLGIYIEAFLKEICEVLNRDLIRQTLELNGWDVTRPPRIVYDAFEEQNLEEFSKAIQRITSVSMIERDREVLNKVRSSLGVQPLPDDMPVQDELLPDYASRSGDGMSTPFEGTRTSDSGQNDNDGNLDNAA